MSSDRRSPWWPYLLVLAGLFVLSLAVPRGWQSIQPEHKLERAPRPTVSAKPKIVPVKPTVVVPNTTIVAQATQTLPTECEHVLPTAATVLAANANHTDPMDRFGDIQPLAEMVSQKIADARRFFAQRREAARAAASTERNPLRSDEVPALPSVLASRPTMTVTPKAPVVATWPSPQSLIAQLDRLSDHLECRPWALRGKQLCETLAATPIDQPNEVLAILGQLQVLAGEADAASSQINDPRGLSEFRRVQYALERRLTAWTLAAAAANRPIAYANVLTGDEQRRRLIETTVGVRTFLDSIPHGDAWAKYLALDEVARLGSAGTLPSGDEARIIARRILGLLTPEQATPAQRRILDDRTIQSLAEQLKPLAIEPIDNREVLAEIEHYEESRRASDAVALVELQQRLAWSADKTDKELAQHLENHYRNANVRVALTSELLKRLAPEPITTYEGVNETIVGTPVHGRSASTIEFQVRLIPDPRRIHLWFEAHGAIASRTQSSSGPATVSNRGAANFIVRKAVLLDEKGLGIGQASTEADTRSQLTGVSTSFDGVPLLGSVVRNIAESQYDEMQEQARWESREKVASRAGQRVDVEVNRRLQDVENRVKREVIDPLANMDLELDPITMETQEQRATLRLRLAGQHQLGGHTARPQAPSDSLASVQLHESALNNVLDQLQLAGRTFELGELYRHLAKRMSRPEPRLPDDLPEGVRITFAGRDPVRVRCEDDKLRLTLAIKELSQGARYWHDFEITTTYKPEVNGRVAKLARDGIIELDGEAYKGKTEFALRGIFSKILSRERTFDLIPSAVVNHPQLFDVCVTQCLIEDGWIGIALGPDRNVVRSNVARRPTAGTLRK